MLINAHMYPLLLAPCRRHADIDGDDVKRQSGWMKLMEQNAKTGSASAARARAGAKIVWIIPLQPDGNHL